jgi:hypothetical protein
LSAKVLINNGWLVEPTIKFINIYLTEKEIQEKESKCMIGLINESEKYPNFYKEFICNNEQRNMVIKKIWKNYKVWLYAQELWEINNDGVITYAC